MESGGESSELLPGDVAVTTNPHAGSPRLGENCIVQVERRSGDCWVVRRFPLGEEQSFVHIHRIKLFWRPSATDAL